MIKKAITGAAMKPFEFKNNQTELFEVAVMLSYPTFTCPVCGNLTYLSPEKGTDSIYCFKVIWYNALLKRGGLEKRQITMLKKDLDKLEIWIPENRDNWSQELGYYKCFPLPKV